MDDKTEDKTKELIQSIGTEGLYTMFQLIDGRIAQKGMHTEMSKETRTELNLKLNSKLFWQLFSLFVSIVAGLIVMNMALWSTQSTMKSALSRMEAQLEMIIEEVKK